MSVIKRHCSDLLDSDAPRFEEVRAASLIQRSYRKLVQKTFNQSYLISQYQQKHAQTPSKIAKLTIHELDINNIEDRECIRKCCKTWKEFIKKKLTKRYTETYKNYLEDCLEVIRFIKLELSCAREGSSNCKLTVIVDQSNVIQAISISSQHENSSIRVIEDLISSPVNAHKKYRKKPCIDGASTALVAHIAFQSKNDKQFKDAPGVLVASLLRSRPYYEHLGFKETSGYRSYSHILTGENLRKFFRSYAGRT